MTTSAAILTGIVVVMLLGLLALALRYGSTSITSTPAAGCLFPDDEVPDTEITPELAEQLHERHRHCPRCPLDTLAVDVLRATGRPGSRRRDA